MNSSSLNNYKAYFIISLIFLPFIASILYTLLYSLGLTGLMNKGYTFNYLSDTITNTAFIKSILYSSYIAFISLCISAFLAFITCWMYIKKPHISKIVLLIIPLTIPPLVVAHAIKNIISPTGFINRVLYNFGLLDLSFIPRMVNDNFGIGIILSHIYIVFPIFTLISIYIVKKESIINIANQAYVLGATEKYFFWNTFIPILIKRMRFFLVMYFIFFINAYEVPLELGQSSKKMLTIFITEVMTNINLYDIPLGYSASFLYAILLLAIYFFMTKKRWNTLW